jgi:hypothetical protein
MGKQEIQDNWGENRNQWNRSLLKYTWAQIGSSLIKTQVLGIIFHHNWHCLLDCPFSWKAVLVCSCIVFSASSWLMEAKTFFHFVFVCFFCPSWYVSVNVVIFILFIFISFDSNWIQSIRQKPQPQVSLRYLFSNLSFCWDLRSKILSLLGNVFNWMFVWNSISELSEIFT